MDRKREQSGRDKQTMKRDMPGAFIRESSMHDRKGGEDMAENIHHPEMENHAAGWNEHAEEQEVMDLRRAIEESRWLEIDIRSRTEQMISLREAAEREGTMISWSGLWSAWWIWRGKSQRKSAG